MPTKPSKARKLVRDGKALGKWNKLNQYYIQLTFTPSGEETQPIAVGLDPGKKFSGIGVQSKLVTLFTAHLFLPFELVKKRMEQRAMMRRTRRGRRINRKLPFQSRAHRQKRFSNRRGKKLAPSIRANRQLEIRVISELCKIFPVTSIVYEYVKADVDLISGRKKARPGKGFSVVMVGQNWAIEQLNKIAPVTKKLGWETANLRTHFGLEKQKGNKKEAIPATHAVDGVALAASQFEDYKAFENSGGHGHCWQGQVVITKAPFFVIRRPPVSRRQLHSMAFAKGGIRRKYGGTVTRHGLRKGDLVNSPKGIGYVSGDTEKQVSVSDTNWKRLGYVSAKKVELLRRSSGLIVLQAVKTA
ncbi:MAG: hypothetical protein RLZZ69_1424 [Cyanobacteriota bacterium]|jgi:hypothetical protein